MSYTITISSDDSVGGYAGTFKQETLARLSAAIPGLSVIPVDAATGGESLLLSFDITPQRLEAIRMLPPELPKILVAVQSLHLCQLAHCLDTLSSPLWTKILTWDRSFIAEHIISFDLPVFAEPQPQLSLPSPSASSAALRGWAYRRSFWDNERPLMAQRAAFLHALQKRRLIKCRQAPPENADGWFDYELVVEDVSYPGFVSDVLPRAILAGRPAIYYGDSVGAERRFPGTFVALPELTVESFLSAREQLGHSFATYRSAVSGCRMLSQSWNDSWCSAVDSLLKFREG